jgi:hypothetical protein
MEITLQDFKSNQDISASLKQWFKEELAPSVYRIADTVFREQHFIKSDIGWTSGILGWGRWSWGYIHINSDQPQHIYEEGSWKKSIVEYVMDRDQVDFIRAIRTLAYVAELQIPSVEELHSYSWRRRIDLSSLMDDAHAYFVNSLGNPPSYQPITHAEIEWLARRAGTIEAHIRNHKGKYHSAGNKGSSGPDSVYYPDPLSDDEWLEKNPFNTSERIEKRRTELLKYNLNETDSFHLLDSLNSEPVTTHENSDAYLVQSYLQERAYSKQDIERMELGVILGQKYLIKHLKHIGYTQSQIDSAFNFDGDNMINNTYKISIPFQVDGKILGFQFRYVDQELHRMHKTPKYRSNPGFNPDEYFFNIDSRKDVRHLLVVEGLLNCKFLQSQGVQGVVATARRKISKSQVQGALSRGISAATLCFDANPASAEETSARIKASVKMMQSAGINRVALIKLPQVDQEETTPEKYVKAEGVEAFQKLIYNAKYDVRSVLRLLKNTY